MILLSGVFGCGITREEPLPNNYTLYIEDFIWIEHPHQQGEVVEDIEQLDIQGDLVFGTRRGWLSDQFLGYFILDTRIHTVSYTSSETEWLDQLTELGVEKPNIRYPGLFFHGYPLWPFVLLVLVLLPVFLLAIWILRQFVLEERQLTQDRLDRL